MTDWPVEFGIFLPQVNLSYDDVLLRARAADELGIHSLWLYDHFYAPGLPMLPSLEGWTLASFMLAQTERLRLGHLVVCNNFRHPALLAKMATSLDVCSGGRLELGIGSGSVAAEHLEAGLPWSSFAERSDRLDEALAVITGMFAEDRTTFSGQHYEVRDLANLPRPVQSPRPPIHVGGVGPRHTLPIVARYADVWNVPVYGLGQWEERQEVLEAECAAIGRDRATIRTSHQVVLVLAEDDDSVAKARASAQRRFPDWNLDEWGFVGTPEAVIDQIRQSVAKGVTFFVFFTHDQARPQTLELFAEHVLPAFAA